MLPLLLTAAALLSITPAGDIYGDVRLGEKYLANTKLELKCGTEPVQTATTDSLGSFRFPVKSAGRCRLTVDYDKQAPSVDVVAFDKPARYRLIVELTGGKYTVKRV